MKRCVFAAIAAGFVSMVLAQDAEQAASANRGAWRIGVGGAQLFGVKSSFALDPAPAIRSLPRKNFSTGRSSVEAALAADNFVNGVLVFDNGFIDPVDSGETGVDTWNWRIDNAADFSADGTLSFRNEFTDFSGVRESSRGLFCDAEDDLNGVTIEFARTLFSKGRFGVDFSAAGTWFDDFECLQAAGKVYSRNASSQSGYVEHRFSAPALVGEPVLVNSDGSIGAGTYEGPGPILEYGSVSALLDSDTSVVRGARHTLDATDIFMSASGEYSRYDLRFALEPYFAFCDALTLRGIFGLAVVYSEFTVKSAATSKGAEIWRRSEKFDETSTCAILGAEISWTFWRGVFISARFESFLGLDDFAIESDFLRGKIEQGDYLLCAALGVNF